MTGFDARRPTIFAGAALFVLIGTGCATKKHVRQVVGPVENRVAQTERKNSEQQAAIGELNNSVSRADEKAQDADRKAVAAGESAQRAGEAAQRAGDAALTAKNRADQGYSLAESTRTRLGEIAENIDNYKVVTTENVLFKVNQAVLTADSKSKLDAAVQQIQNTKHYVLEIQGFTDKTGSAAQNLDLSRRRADAVVRYLTTQHQIPLRRVNVLGLGEDDPSADNKTRKGRQQARRVEVKVFALDLGSQNQGAQSTTTTGAADMSIPRTTGSAAAAGTAGSQGTQAQ